jgi:hypothetical protein
MSDNSDYADSKCDDPKLVDQFIEDFSVEVWTLTEKINFEEIRFEKPIYYILQLLN